MAYIDQLEKENRELRQVIRERMFVPATEYGNCRNGCPPSYLDRDGYCSPACHLGGPRGQFAELRAN